MKNKKNTEQIYSPELLPSPGVVAFQIKKRQIITPTFMPLFVAILEVYIFDLDISEAKLRRITLPSFLERIVKLSLLP